jgi:hypothetical protein
MLTYVSTTTDREVTVNDSTRHLWDTKIHGAPVTLIAQNPRQVGEFTEWDLTDGDDTEYGTVRTNEHSTSLSLHRRMAQGARAYWKTH